MVIEPAVRMVAPRRQQNYVCPIRDVLDRVGDAWSFLIVMRLEHGTRRFNQLKREVDGISQRMLTVTLRNLERDGFVARRVVPSAPPQVEYSLTPLGVSLSAAVMVLADWAERHHGDVQEARRAYDITTVGI